MLSLLLRIFSLVFFLWLLKRLLAAILGGPKPGKPWDNPAKSAQKMVKDPVCGMYMDSRLAVRLENKNEILHFCSEECKQKYLSGSSGEGTNSDVAG